MFSLDQVRYLPTGSGEICFHWIRSNTFPMDQVKYVSTGSGKIPFHWIRWNMFPLRRLQLTGFTGSGKICFHWLRRLQLTGFIGSGKIRFHWIGWNMFPLDQVKHVSTDWGDYSSPPPLTQEHSTFHASRPKHLDIAHFPRLLHLSGTLCLGKLHIQSSGTFRTTLKTHLFKMYCC